MDTKLRVLILEDDAADAGLTGDALWRGGLDVEMRRVDTKEAFLREIDHFNPQLILAGYAVPSFGGMAALDICRKHCPDVPFIVVTGSIGEELAIETLKQGATDYVLKQRLSRLVPVVHRALRESEERVKRRLTEEALRVNELKFRELFNNLNDAVLLYELTPDLAPGRILEVNDIACRILGYERYELLEMSRVDLQPREDMEALAKVLRNRHRKGGHTFETTFKSKFGGKIPFEVNTRIFTLKGAEVLLSIARDITDRKQAQAARERLILELQDALANVKSLKELLPICSWCKRIRDDKGYWLEVEAYLLANSEVDFSHGICPECSEKYKKTYIEEKARRSAGSASTGS